MSDQLANEERLRLLVQNAADVVAVVDAEGTVSYVSPAVTRLLGYDPAGIIGSSAFSFIHPDDIPRVQAAFAEALSGKGPVQPHEFRARRADGQYVELENVVTNLLHEPAVRGIVVNARDISERKQIERELRASNERFRMLVEGSRDILSYRYRFVPEPACEYMSPGAETVLGISPQAFYDDPDLWRTLVHPDDLARLEGIRDLAAPVVVRWRRAGGSYAWLEHRRAKILDDEGRTIGIEGIAHDVTERRVALEALETSERRFRSLVQNVSDLVVTVDRDGHLGYVSPSVTSVMGFAPQELENGHPEFVHPDDLPALRSAFERANRPDGTMHRATCRTQHKDGSLRWLEYQVVNRFGDPSVDGWVVTARDVTERKEAEEQLIHQALHDALTGLPNRALFLDRLGLALSRLERRRSLAAVFFLDLDHFKVVNDSLGHSAGDQVLMAVAERLQRSLRDGDTAARLGGDEFAILCEDLIDEGEAVQIAERLGAAVSSEPVRLSGRDLVLTASIGVAFADEPRHQPEALLRDADAAMYRAKERGRARYELFDAAMRHRALTRLETEAALRRAIEERELVLFYQPEVRLSDGAVIGVEALLRWRDGRYVSRPGDFLAVAEETGLIVPIGEWVVHEACRHLRRWRQLAPDRVPGMVSVNLSGRQLAEPALPDLVAHALAQFDIEPSAFRVEITEGALIDDLDGAVEALKTLKGLGVQIAVDDFGTGYSSLAHLRRFPVDTLKVDRSFIAGLGRNPEDAAIVGTVLGLARTLDLEVVAEGVERVEQLEELRTMGCERAQGDLFSPPLSEEDLVARLMAT